MKVSTFLTLVFARLDNIRRVDADGWLGDSDIGCGHGPHGGDDSLRDSCEHFWSQACWLRWLIHLGRSFNKYGFERRVFVWRSMKNFGLDLDVRELFTWCGWRERDE